MASFNSYMSQFKVSKGARMSHLGMDQMKGCYFIPEEQKQSFLTKYFDHVFIRGGTCDLIERHNKLCCLLYDLDFKLPKESKDRAYTKESIKHFTKCVTRIVSKYIDAPCGAYQAFVCEKSRHLCVKIV